MTYKNIIKLFLFAILLSSCKDNNNKELQKEVVANDRQEKDKPVAKKKTSLAATLQMLKETPPLHTEDLEKRMPANLMGLPLKSVSTYELSESPENTAIALYADGSKKIEYRITDMAGPNAKVFMALQLTLGKEKFDQETGSYYQKAVKKEGYVADEIYEHGGNEKNTQLKFMHENRFYVHLKAFGFSPDEIWESIEKFNLKNLNNENI